PSSSVVASWSPVAAQRATDPRRLIAAAVAMVAAVAVLVWGPALRGDSSESPEGRASAAPGASATATPVKGGHDAGTWVVSATLA
ncbi:hypothetical protein, partial [Knoellia sinensis]|uniref:hypothetical protein n=1 Tax=Knoellia sinensis TaxID=136100 RepID=UPI000560E936